MRDFFVFVGKCLKTGLKHTWGVGDVISTFIGIAVPFILWLNPKWLTPSRGIELNQLCWLAPASGMAAISIIRLIISPYWVWKETQVKYEETIKKTEAERDITLAQINAITDARVTKKNDLLQLANTIKRRTEEIFQTTLNGFSTDAELYDAITSAFVSHEEFNRVDIPTLAPTLIQRCLDSDEELILPSFVQLGRICSELNSTIENYMTKVSLEKANKILRLSHDIYRLTDQTLPKEIETKL